jgi:hypothetical protein
MDIQYICSERLILFQSWDKVNLRILTVFIKMFILHSLHIEHVYIYICILHHSEFPFTGNSIVLNDSKNLNFYLHININILMPNEIILL